MYYSLLLHFSISLKVCQNSTLQKPLKGWSSPGKAGGQPEEDAGHATEDGGPAGQIRTSALPRPVLPSGSQKTGTSSSKTVLLKPERLPGWKFKATLGQGCLVPVFGLGI